MRVLPVRKRAIVSGVVQGVGFRWSARTEAKRLGVTGFARNLADATVEVEAEGPPAAVAAFIGWLHKGPPGARVGAVDLSDVSPRGSSSFDVD